MMRILKRPVWLAIAASLLVWVFTAGAAYGVTVFTKSLNASLNIDAQPDFSYYSDAAATQGITNVNLPNVKPGGTATFTVYLKNTSSITETVTAGANTVPASAGSLTLTFDGAATKTLAPGAVTKIVGTISVPKNASTGSINFNFSVNAAPDNVVVPPPTGSTSSTTTTQVVSGQQLFASYCLSCHSSGVVNTSRSHAQLLQFIPGHQTGTNLSSSQVAAIAAFLKP